MEKSNVTFVHLSLFNCSRTWKSEKQKGENPVPNNDEQLAITLQTVIFCSFHTLVRRPEYVTDQTRKECLCTLYVPTWLSGIHVTERSHRGDIGSPISSSRSPWGYNRSVCMMRKWEKVTQLGVTKPAQLTTWSHASRNPCNWAVFFTGNFSENYYKISFKRRIPSEMLQVVDLSREKVHSFK